MRIAVGSKVRFAIDGRSGQIDPKIPADGARLTGLLNQDITDATVIGKGDLVLRFGTAGEITLQEDDSGFENYTLYLEGELPIDV